MTKMRHDHPPDSKLVDRLVDKEKMHLLAGGTLLISVATLFMPPLLQMNTG